MSLYDTPGHLGVRRAIDVGAGTGRFTRVLAEAVGGRIVAVEPSAGMVAEREIVDAHLFVFER